MKKIFNVSMAMLVIFALLMSVVPVFAHGGPPPAPVCEKGSSLVCTEPTVEKVCKKWVWGMCVKWETKVTPGKCECVPDEVEPGIPVTGGPSWDWPNRTCADQGNCVAPEDAEYTIEEMKAPPAGTMYMIYTSADKFEWSYLDPAKNVLGPGIDGWFNNGNDRIYLVANEPFSVVTDAGMAIPSAASDKVKGLQFLNAPTTGDLILLFGTFEGEFASADVEANRWRTSGIAAGTLQRLVVEIDTCAGAFLD